MHASLLGEGADAGRGSNGPTCVITQTAGILEYGGRTIGAQGQPPREAVAALPAEYGEAGDDAVAGSDRSHVGADRLDEAGSFMTEQDGSAAGKGAVHLV